jgi:paraquat-inducible protein B
MPDSPQRPELPELPAVKVKVRMPWSVQIIWIIPILAILFGLSLLYKAEVDRGSVITIAFKDGDGFVAGKTHVQYKGVQIGLVTSVALSTDNEQVIVTVQLDKNTSNFTKEDASYWVVRPQITTSGVSGLSTLLSGPYIAADLGRSTEKQKQFVALDVPPILTGGTPGREFTLKAPSLGSHSVGTPVYFRRLTVGEVVAYDLDADGKEIAIKVFIHAPYDQYVTTNTRFWNASGVDITIGPAGLQIQTESLISVLVGGIAFETPQPNGVNILDVNVDINKSANASSKNEPPALSERAQVGQVFKLFQTRATAIVEPYVLVQRVVINFEESVRGLSVGAPVEFRGVHIGEVAHIGLAYDLKTFVATQPVEINIYPETMLARSTINGAIIPIPKTKEGRSNQLQSLVDHGLRAQLRSLSLLTGEKYIGLDFYPNAPKFTFDTTKEPFELQYVPGKLESFEESVTNVVANADKLLKKIDANIVPEVSKVLVNTDKFLKKIDANIVPELKQVLSNVDDMTMSDSPLLIDIRDSLRELTKAANSIKTLADMLDQQPQSLIYGKPLKDSQ